MRDDRMVIRADAKAIGAVTAMSKKAAPRWKSSGTKSGDCVSILPDGSRVPFSVTRTRDDSRLNRHITHRNTLTKTDKIHAAIMNLPSIHKLD